MLGAVCIGYGLLARGSTGSVPDGPEHAAIPPSADAEPVAEASVPAPRTVAAPEPAT